MAGLGQRLARARQIAMYGDVPFRDFFDPGYFLTLYASAFVERALGDNLLGEMLLNVGCMTAAIPPGGCWWRWSLAWAC